MALRWKYESYRKLYTREEGTFRALSLSARALGKWLMTIVDDDGVIVLGGKLPHIAIAIQGGAEPTERRRLYTDVADLLREGYLVKEGDTLRIRNFKEAQERRDAEPKRAREALDERPRDIAATPERQPNDVSATSARPPNDIGATRELANPHEITGGVSADQIRPDQSPEGFEERAHTRGEGKGRTTVDAIRELRRVLESTTPGADFGGSIGGAEKNQIDMAVAGVGAGEFCRRVRAFFASDEWWTKPKTVKQFLGRFGDCAVLGDDGAAVGRSAKKPPPPRPFDGPPDEERWWEIPALAAREESYAARGVEPYWLRDPRRARMQYDPMGKRLRPVLAVARGGAA